MCDDHDDRIRTFKQMYTLCAKNENLFKIKALEWIEKSCKNDGFFTISIV